MVESLQMIGGVTQVTMDSCRSGSHDDVRRHRRDPAAPPPGGPRPRPRRGFRLTSRVFWDMAIYMVGLGLAVGVIFPPFAILLGVPDTITARPVFRTACLMA